MHPLKKLLNDFDKISQDHEEINDTDVRECLSEGVIKLLGILSESDIPNDFGMFSEVGNAKIRQSLVEFIHLLKISGIQPFGDKSEAIRYIQNRNVVSDLGNYYDEYMGHIDLADKGSLSGKPWWKFW